MNGEKIIGLTLLALGIVLVVVGLNSSHSAVDRVSDAVTGRFTDNTTWYIGGGIVAGVAGISMLLFGTRSKNA